MELSFHVKQIFNNQESSQEKIVTFLLIEHLAVTQDSQEKWAFWTKNNNLIKIISKTSIWNMAKIAFIPKLLGLSVFRP